MRILLDTHIFLWVANHSPELNAQAREFLDNAAAIYVSSASIWEIAIKVRRGKLAVDPDAMAAAIGATGFEELPVMARHAVGVARLPLVHGDPFDRMLVAQAMCESLTLLTADAKLQAYPATVVTI